MVKLTDVPTGEQLYADHAGKYWDGRRHRSVFAALRDPASAQPYCVRISGHHWIPVNHLVHASSEDEALERCVETIRYCAEHQYQDPDPRRLGPHVSHILEEMMAGQIFSTVQPIDKLVICHLEWAANSF